MARAIALTNSKNFAIVSDCDFESISKHSWYECDGYAHRMDGTARARNRRVVLMHRQILSYPKGLRVDHANMDRLDNRRENIRVATAAQNAVNSFKRLGFSSRYRGVYWGRSDGKWKAILGARSLGVRMSLGSFELEDDAAMAIDVAYSILFKEFHRPNIPDGLHLLRKG